MNWKELIGESIESGPADAGFEIFKTSDPEQPTVIAEKVISPALDQTIAKLIEAKEQARLANNKVSRIEREIIREGLSIGTMFGDDACLVLTENSEVVLKRTRALIMEDDGADLHEDILAISKRKPSVIEIQPSYLNGLEDDERKFVEEHFTEKVREWRVKIPSKKEDAA